MLRLTRWPFTARLANIRTAKLHHQRFPYTSLIPDGRTVFVRPGRRRFFVPKTEVADVEGEGLFDLFFVVVSF